MLLATLVKGLTPGAKILPISTDDPTSGHLAAFVVRQDGTDDMSGIADMVDYLASSTQRWVAIYNASVMDKFHVSSRNNNIAYAHEAIDSKDYSVMSVEEFKELLK